MASEARKGTPNPGSPSSVQEGCRCPMIDNRFGNGYMGMEGVFVYSSACPIHKKESSNGK